MADNKLQTYWSFYATPETGVIRRDFHGITDLLEYLARKIMTMYRVVQQRRALLELDEHLLADIGIDRNTALAEAARAPWDSLPRS